MLLTLPPELYFFIYIELEITDTLALHLNQQFSQTCRLLQGHGRTKALWIRLLDRSFHGGPIPPSLINYTSFDAATLETLARRISTLSRREDLPPIVSHAWRTQLPRGIQWVGLAASRWLIVASSDRQISTLQCWDLTCAFNGDDHPVAQIYLPAQVKTAKLEVQRSGIILALGLMNPSTALYVVSLKRKSDRVVFVHEYSLIGSSHVLMLHDALVGCAIREALNEPHVVNWKTGTILDIEPPPGGLDILSRRSVPHFMTMWTEDTLLIVRLDGLEFYHREGDRFFFRQLLIVDDVQEVTVCKHCDPSHLQLAVLTQCDIQIWTLRQDNHDIVLNGIKIEYFNPYTLGGCPIFRLRTSQSGTRVIWISTVRWVRSRDRPSLAIFRLSKQPPNPSDSTSALTWKDDDVHAPALWAFCNVDYDDILGLTVIGNHFGELAVYDHVGGYARLVGSSFGAAPVLAAHNTVISEALNECVISSSPFYLNIPLPVTRVMTHAELMSSRAAKWAKDKLDLNPQCWMRTDFTPDKVLDETDRFPKYDAWEGQPSDNAWILSHLYGFPGEVLPQASRIIEGPHDSEDDAILFRLCPNGSNVSPNSWSSRSIGRYIFAAPVPGSYYGFFFLPQDFRPSGNLSVREASWLGEQLPVKVAAFGESNAYGRGLKEDPKYQSVSCWHEISWN
ncbi:hypothetical protein MIND_00085900 [Mycena indigotica]|uniref:F-box domain-containing protein n=1 Tax=Mycena indigotica TaxID=2126181 RepID=A0A8H6TBX5_9AGAR|nr:uncharacterized protein MIND_00085900 [Mycena indigotica]KAF7315703.1 hypothetical protein MIND_00085900 [Mycena indigotica]